MSRENNYDSKKELTGSKKKDDNEEHIILSQKYPRGR